MKYAKCHPDRAYPQEDTMTSRWWSSSSGRIEIQIPEAAIKDCANWEPYINWHDIPRESFELELKEYGAWDDLKTAPLETLKHRVLWIACGDLQ